MVPCSDGLPRLLTTLQLKEDMPFVALNQVTVELHRMVPSFDQETSVHVVVVTLLVLEDIVMIVIVLMNVKGLF